MLVQERRILLVPLHDLLDLVEHGFGDRSRGAVCSTISLLERVLDLLHEPVDLG